MRAIRRRLRGIRWAPAVLVLALVPAAACGSNAESASAPKADAPTTTTEATAGKAGDAGSGAPGEGGDGAPSPGDPVDAGATGGAPADVKAAGGAGGDAEPGETGSSLPLSATFAKACVRPGTPQTITVRSAPDVQAIYHATYSDGKTARDPGYYGGHEISTTDAEGRWEDTWVVGPAAPPGTVRVDVVATSWETFTNIVAEFSVANPNGRCT